MTGGNLDFFVLEAGEYTEQLDGVLARASDTIPDLDVFTRNARALRGSATVARVEGVAKVATGLERLGRGLRDGSLQWTPQLRAAIVSAIDDAKFLVRSVRAPGPADDARAAARVAELDALAPASSRRSVVTPMMAAGSGLWMAAEAAEIAHGLRKWCDQMDGPGAFANTVRKVRALRGTTALADLPPLGQVSEIVDDAAKAIEGGAAPTEAHRSLFRAAADVLREASAAIASGGKPATDSAIVATFHAAASLLAASTEGRDYVVPIASLFPDGPTSGVVHTAPNPPTTPSQRFRTEIVGQAEHLRRLVADAQRADEGPLRQRAAIELRGAVLDVQSTAESFGETHVARAVKELGGGAATLDVRALTALDQLAAALAAGTPIVAAPMPGVTPRVPQPVAPAIMAPVMPHAPVAAMPMVSRATGAIVMPAPTGVSLQEALATGLSGLSRLDVEPLAEPAPIDEAESLVPIQQLLYRGRAALTRAIAVGAVIKSHGATPDQETLAELLDLLELAATE